MKLAKLRDKVKRMSRAKLRKWLKDRHRTSTSRVHAYGELMRRRRTTT